MTTDLLASGAEWLRDVFRSHVAQPVTYHRATAMVQLRATVGNTTVEEMADDVVVRRQTRDWIILDRDDLILNGERATPQEGDTIKWRFGEKEYTYEVTPVGGNAYEPDGGFEMGWRVHTQLVNVA